VTGADGKVMLTASRRNFRDVEDCPVFELRIGDTDKEFKVSLLMENLQMLMPCDYSVEVSYRMGVEGLKALGHFAAPDMDYWMTVEEADCIPVNRELWRQREVAAARAKEQKADLTETIKKLSEDEIVRVRAFIQELDSKPQQQETA